MLDSPFEFCTVCRAYVLLDQTHKECRREHHCMNARCPLAKLFSGIDFGAKAEGTAKAPGGKPRAR